MAIRGFEKHTHPLTPGELELVPLMLAGFGRHVGKANAISAAEITRKMRDLKYNVTPMLVRKIVHHLVVTDALPGLVACSKGYYVAENHMELREWLDGARDRIAAQQARVDAVEKQYRAALTTRQLSLSLAN